MSSVRSIASVAVGASIALSAAPARAQLTSYQGAAPGNGGFSVTVLAGLRDTPLSLGTATSATFQVQPLPAGSPAYKAPSGTAVVQFGSDNRLIATYGPRSCLAQGACARVTIVQTTPQTTTTYTLDGVQVTQYQVGGSPMQVSLAFRAYQWMSQPTPRQQNGTLGQHVGTTYKTMQATTP